MSTVLKSRWPKPEIGMGATVKLYTDRHAATICGIVGKQIWVRRDIAKRIDENGMSDNQVYEFITDPVAPVEKFSLRKDGRYVKVRHSHAGPQLWVGIRSHYRDFSY